MSSGTGANYAKGGGPNAFKKQKKVEKGPKEFNALFSMADKISDRKKSTCKLNWWLCHSLQKQFI